MPADPSRGDEGRNHGVGRRQLRLRVITRPEPGTRIVLDLKRGLMGAGAVDLLCGGCGDVLAAGLPDERLDKLQSAVVQGYLRRGGVRVSGARQELVLRCPACGAYNTSANG